MDSSWPTIVIMFMWCPIFALLNTYYAFLVVLRLRKHRHSFASTLSSTGSNLTSRRFLRLFMFSCSILVIYLPVIFYYFYLNLMDINLSSQPYSWSRIHDPKIWQTIKFWQLKDQPGLQYDGWPNVAQSLLVFCFFGMGNQALEAYREFLVRIGLNKMWPRLNQPVGINHNFSRRGSTASWSGRFDLVGVALRYFDTSRKPGQATGIERSLRTKSRKGSAATFDHISLAHMSSRAKSPSEFQRRDTLTPDTFSSDPDSIDPVPLFSVISAPEPVVLPSPSVQPDRAVPANQPLQSYTRSVFGSFRTQLNLPFSLFKRSSCNKPHEVCTCENSSCPTAALRVIPDLEAQNYEQAQLKKTPEVVSPFAKTATVETQIWAEAPVHSSAEDDDDGEPKLGTRAYRERERRELEALRKERQAVIIESSVEQTRT
ncbi:pheromone receptor 1 [Phlyctema vagabunda]|uniref:Pheromone receptor 1 n=1 Tax=Phlyctema vagabunda TaxID=108571 RepID=A0ABR4P7A8_9HELO